MSENFDMLVWRANAVDANGDTLTTVALLSMANALIPGAEITRDFVFNHPVGHIVQPWVQNDELHVTAVFTDPDVIEAIREGKVSLRPGFSIGASHQVNDKRVIDEVDQASVALTPNPMPLPGEITACEHCTDKR